MLDYSSAQAGQKLSDCASKNCCFNDGHTLVVDDNGLSPGKKSPCVVLKHNRG